MKASGSLEHVLGAEKAVELGAASHLHDDHAVFALVGPTSSDTLNRALPWLSDQANNEAAAPSPRTCCCLYWAEEIETVSMAWYVITQRHQCRQCCLLRSQGAIALRSIMHAIPFNLAGVC